MDSSLGDSGALGMSTQDLPQDNGYHVSNYTQLQKALTTASEKDINIFLDRDIPMENFIDVPANKNIVIDGQGHFIDEAESKEWNFRIGANTSFTIQNATLYGRTNFAITKGVGVNVTLSFHHVTYVGPQMVYNAHSGADLVVTDSNIYIQEYGDMKGHSGRAEEAFETPRFTLGGDVLIEHLTHPDTRYIMDAVFYATGEDSNRYLNIMDGANVTVNTGSFFFFTAGVPTSIRIGENAVLNVNACGGMSTPGEGADRPDQWFNSFVIERNGVFTYTQRNSTAKPAGIHEQDYGRGLIITRELRMEPGSVFAYDSEYDDGRYGGSGGLLLYNAAVTLNSPRLFSIYNPAGALHTGRYGALYDWTTTTFQVNGINALNYWTDADRARPVNDRVVNLPNRLWNRWFAQGDSRVLGPAFDLQINSKGAVSAPGDLLDLVSGNGALNGLNIRTTDMKRLALGTIAPYEVDLPGPFDTAISGRLREGDLQISYSVGNDLVTLGEEWIEGEFSIGFGEKIPPVGGTGVRSAANSLGLRAIIDLQAEGELAIKSVPTLFYGVNPLPAAATVYPRTDDGPMEVVVVDTRGREAAPWSLTVRLASEGPEDGSRPLPANSLLYRNNGYQAFLSTDADIRAYTHTEQPPSAKPVETVASWDGDNGIFACIGPEQVSEAGDYRATLVWSFGIVP